MTNKELDDLFMIIHHEAQQITESQMPIDTFDNIVVIVAHLVELGQELTNRLKELNDANST